MSNSLMPQTDVANRITQAYPTFSSGNRRAADYVLRNPLEVVAMSIEGLAEHSGTSSATITRFVRTLGYASYSEFRAALASALRHTMAPVDSFADTRTAAGGPFATFAAALAMQANNLQSTRDTLEEPTVTGAIEVLLNARRIYLAGSGASYHIASYLEDGLALYLNAAVIFGGARGDPQRAVRHMMSAGAEDVVLAVSIPRYARSTVDLCTFAKKRGATLVALTDVPTSPLARIADICLYTPARALLLPNTPTAAFAVADALITTVARERPEAVENLKNLSENRFWTFQE
ncbi:MurR/RpiR family transcriptional regulator [Azospirillum griseum]|uniref:MurR/RpiR family transcriptional regulator n=1 Tax=Azospirillum griseum TaxID=2496639 RepID=A0A431VA07_9PROT|nr:MurR/RpiR family transcriptional regulator [Azospirillum griseum]RTR12776.1 MurR/RpiR family transcriptional regulator [Azospirillum griseum]